MRVSGSKPEVVFDALVGANATNLLSFDLAQQDKVRIGVSDNIGWLDFTHAITFAAASRELCGRHPGIWPDALLQLACFCGRNARYTQAEPPAPESAAAAASQQPAEAVSFHIDPHLHGFAHRPGVGLDGGHDP